jgi:hypothetical protein
LRHDFLACRKMHNCRTLLHASRFGLVRYGQATDNDPTDNLDDATRERTL